MKTLLTLILLLSCVLSLQACADSSQKGDILDREYVMNNSGGGNMNVNIYIEADTKNQKTGDQSAEGGTTSVSPSTDLTIPIAP